ncbi:MAG: DUF418 domain-containing protein [Acidobacteria bacterium]|nr:MAG: DUF418 domain-containing protein [Acidobacteriota bacterium]
MTAAAPRSPGDRLTGIDAARGFALLGIFLVNIDFMALPLGVITAPAGGSVAEVVARSFVAIFCEGKFYPLFSLLFGAGLVLQMRSVERRGGRFVPLYLRRLAVLAAIGLTHALLLWYGDILLMYAAVGVVVLAAVRLLGARGLAIAGVAAWLLAGLLLGGLSMFEPPVPAEERASRDELLAEALAIELDESPLRSLVTMVEQASSQSTLVDEPQWMAAEIAAYRDGPYLQALGFRAMSFGFVFLVYLFGGALDILAMFLLGAALCRWGLFDAGGENAARGEKWLLRLVGLAMLVGLPGSAFSHLAPDVVGGYLGNLLQEMLRVYCGPFLSAGMLAGLVLLARSGLARALVDALAAAGRMALSNYLLQTLIGTFVTYHWGLGMFGRLGALDRIWLVVGVFVAQVLLSQWWLQRFRFGPMEWLWRSATYWRRQPMRRGA